MNWKEILTESFAFHGPDASLEFYPPVNAQEIFFAEQELDLTFPQDLKDLLTETNGVGQRLHLEHSPDGMLIGHFIWPVERIVADNKAFRTDSPLTRTCMPFDSLLFFSDAGNGDLFGFAIVRQPGPASRIYRWDHEDDSRACIARSLKEFLMLP